MPVLCFAEVQAGFQLFFKRHVALQTFAAPVPAISHFAQYLPVAAAQLWMLLIVIAQEVCEGNAPVIDLDDGADMLPDITHAVESKKPLCSNGFF